MNPDESASQASARADLRALRAALGELNASWDELTQRSEQLAGERQCYLEFFDLAPDPYLVTDASGLILEANRAAAQLLGCPARRLTGKPLAILVAFEQRRAFRERLAGLKAGAACTSPWRMRLGRPGRPSVDVSVGVSPFDGSPRGFFWRLRTP